MIKLLTSGGLGDAVMSFAKAEKLNIDRNNFIVYHARIREDNLDNTIVDFYSSQGITSKIVRVHNDNKRKHQGEVLDDWLLENLKRYNYYLGTHWSANNGSYSRLDSWEIDPFPKVKYSKTNDCKILLNPSSGGTEDVKKSFDQKQIEKFLDKYPETVIIGKGNDIQYEKFSNSLYNKTSMKDLVNLIASSEVVVSPEGFVPYFAGMCGKTVYVKDENIKAIENRKHPEWDFNIINTIEDIP